MAVTQGTMIKSFVSAIDFLDEREIDPKLYDQSRDRAFTDIMKWFGRRKPTSMHTYHNFTNNDAYETATISAVTTTGTAAPVFTINTASTFPRVGDLIISSNPNNTNAQAYIRSISYGSGTATITGRSVGGNSAPFYVTVGDQVGFTSNAFAEKSDAPTNRRYGVTKYYNQTQIFREVDEISDVQKVAAITLTIDGKTSILPYQLIQKVIKLNGDISVQMISGVQSTTTFSDTNPFLSDPISGLPIQTTGGLNWYTITYGIDDEAAVLGTFGWTEMNQIIDNWIANKAPQQQMGLMASKTKGILDRFFKNLGSSGVTSVRMVIDGKTMNFDVDHISYRGFDIDFVHLPILDHPQLYSATLTPDIHGSIFFIPKDDVETVDGGRSPRIQIRYTPSPFMGANGSSDGVMKEWRTGALAEVPTSSVAQLRTDWYTEQGLECLAVKHFQKFRVV